MRTSVTSKEVFRQFITRRPAQTRKLAAELGSLLEGGEIIFLYGGLGAGKTFFVQGLAKGLDIDSPRDTASPSFTIINEYPGPIPLFHVDLYRLEKNDDIYSLGLEEYFGTGAVAVEWAEKLPPDLRRPSFEVTFDIVNASTRLLSVTATGRNSSGILLRLTDLLPEGYLVKSKRKFHWPPDKPLPG